MTYQRDSKVQVYRCKKHQFNSLMLFKIHVRLELSWIIKEKRTKKQEKRKKKSPAEMAFFLEDRALNTEHMRFYAWSIVFIYLFF